jgi:hypothetical protein
MASRLAMIAISVSALFAVGAVSPGLAHAQSKCAASKQKLAGKKASAKLKCWSKGVKNGVQADPNCLSKATFKFSSKWDKAEAKGGCTTTGDKTTIENKVDAFVDDVVDELGGSPAGAILTTDAARKCAATKIKTAGKKAAAKLKCTAKGAQRATIPDPNCLSKATFKFSSKWDKAEAKGGCATTGDKTTIENKVDAFVLDTAAELPGAAVTTTTTSTTTSTTTTSSPIGSCCGSVRIQTTSSAGTLQVSTLPAFPFPPNVQTTVEVDAGTPFPGCKHSGIVPAGGFTVPVFCIPGLMYTSQVTALGCESGGADGQGVVWDAAASAPDPNVTRFGDTSDGVCNPAGQPCNTSAGGAGANTLGDINTTRGGSPLASGKVETQVDIPVNSLTWQAADLSCPDSDGTFDPGNDTQVTNFDFILSPTSRLSSAKYTDLNGDSCSRSGNGPDSMTATGSPATGPCCMVGQATTVVATGIAFTGSSPLYDITFKSITPTTISDCGIPVSTDTCTLTTNPCQD